MKTIFKYDIPFEPNTYGKFDVTGFVGSKAVACAIQNGKRVMWLEVDVEKPNAILKFAIVGTGREVPDGYTHFGTFFEEGFVWHVYQKS